MDDASQKLSIIPTIPCHQQPEVVPVSGPYLGGSSDGRGWFGGHCRVSYGQRVDGHSARHTDCNQK